jgi:hypothetical protein
MRTVWRAASQTMSGVVLLLTIFAASNVALAQPADPLQQGGAAPPPGGEGVGVDSARAGLSVADPRVEVSLQPGAAVEGELRFTYDGSAPSTGQVSVVSYRIGPDGPSVLPPGAGEAYGAAGWTSVDPTILVLRPATAETVHYRVQVPPGVAPGDYSALVLLAADPPGARVGVRLVVSVPGEARRAADLLAFEAQRQPLRLLSYQIPNRLPLFEGGPIQFRAQVQNRGNVQFAANGTVQIFDALGNPFASLDLPVDRVLPGDTGTFTAPWASPPAVGFFTARLSLETGGAPSVAEERLLVLPWQQVLAAVLFVVLLGLLLGPRLSLPLRGRRRASSDAVLRSHVAKYQEHQAAETAPARSLDAAPGGAVSPEQAPPDPVAVSSERADPSAGRLTSSGQGSELAPLELLRQGREAARAGDRLVAYRLFVHVLELDPDSEEAWLWRAGTAEQPDEMVRCLTRVLEINPDNPRARRGLAEVQERLAGRVQESA